MIPQYMEMDSLKWEVTKSVLADDRSGECYGEECRIVLANRLCNQMQELTFFHELIHMICRSRDYGEDKEYTEEEMATMLGPALYTFFKTNANIVWKDECCAF